MTALIPSTLSFVKLYHVFAVKTVTVHITERVGDCCVCDAERQASDKVSITLRKSQDSPEY